MLFTSIEELKNHLVVGAGTDFNRLRPHIANAETAYIRPLLGSSLFDELQDYYTDRPEAVENGNPSPELIEAMEELLLKVQKSLIHLAYWMGFQVLNSTISDSGFKRTENDKQKSLFKYQEDELKEMFKTAGFNAMDEILEFIEANIEHFNEFKLSANWTILKSSFIPDTKTFNSIISSINGSRLIFLRLKSFAMLVEDLDIRPTLGDTIFEEIKTEMQKDTPAEKVITIMPYIRKAVAFLATAMLMEETGADLTDKGLYFESTSAGFNNDRNKQPASAERITALAAKYRMYGSNYLEGLKSFLIRNATDWPDYSGQTGNVLRRDNANKKTFWT